MNKLIAYIKAKKCGRLLILLSVSVLLSAPGIGAVKRYVPPTAEQIETDLLEMINQARELQGRKRLLFHPFLQEIARSHSYKMAAEGKLSHYFSGWPIPEQKLRLGSFCFLASAENIAHSPTPFAQLIHEALMASVMHRINILDERMLQAGIGVCLKENNYYVSEEFAAIIDCPILEEAMVFIENELCRWYKEKFNVFPIILSEARLRAKVSAQMHLFNNPITFEPFSDRKMQGINICYNDLRTILAELKKEIKNSNIKSLAVGVFWGSNTSFPGGTYSVCLFLFE